jgi:hypothetical protein
MKILSFLLSAASRCFAPLSAETSYRPERHYMRGPGPKWHERRGLPYAPSTASLPAPASLDERLAGI